jgi:hypothetical protein
LKGKLVAALAVVIAGLALVPTASADTPGCVTKAEFRKVSKGDGIRRVHRIFDTKGKQTAYMSGSAYYPAWQSRQYRGCPSYSIVSVDYERKAGVWRVVSKFAVW